MKIINIFFTILSLVSSFSPRIYNKDFGMGKIKIYEPKNVLPSKSILFFTGGNSYITSDIYNNFLTQLSSKNISVHVASNNLEANKEVLDTLVDEYDSTLLVGHSSSLQNLIKVTNWNKKIKKVVLLDPVKGVELPSVSNFVPFFGWFGDNIEFPKFRHIEELKTIKAMRSSKWEPFSEKKIPFLLWFAAEPKHLVNKNVHLSIEEFPNHGHTDILDSQWSDIMHNTISKGVEDRDIEKLYEYHEQVASIINEFIGENEDVEVVEVVEDEDCFIPSSNNKNKENGLFANSPLE
tara:strand:+ start:5381 stop:6259 length:879 start_codon:yes stop_codon:yes gene_type:complete